MAVTREEVKKTQVIVDFKIFSIIKLRLKSTKCNSFLKYLTSERSYKGNAKNWSIMAVSGRNCR